MVANFEDSYSGALLIGFKQQLTAWDVERDVFGSNHGEIGAYLLGLWGMPLNILEAAALHHEPSRSPNKAFSPLTAVHVANVLERESSPDELGMISPKLDEVYLDGLGLLKRVKVWREAIANRDGVKLQSEIPGEKAVEADPVASAKPASAAAPSTPASASAPSQQTQFIPARRLRVREPEVVVAKSKVIFAAVGACVVAFLTWLVIATFNNELDSTQITLAAPIKEKPARVKAAVLAVAAPKTDQSAASAKPSDHTAPKPASAANLALSLLPATEVRARETTNASTVPAPKPAPAPEFKLQGIFFSSGDPSAILNGKTVRPNERINGALVVSITASNVTLQIQDQRKVLAIK
jgi:hypothetical protein